MVRTILVCLLFSLSALDGATFALEQELLAEAEQAQAVEQVIDFGPTVGLTERFEFDLSSLPATFGEGVFQLGPVQQKFQDRNNGQKLFVLPCKFEGMDRFRLLAVWDESGEMLPVGDIEIVNPYEEKPQGQSSAHWWFEKFLIVSSSITVAVIITQVVIRRGGMRLSIDVKDVGG